MSLLIEPRTRSTATKECQDRELHMCTKTEVSQLWGSLTESLQETEFLKFFAWVDDGKNYAGDPKMCMVDAAATSAGAADAAPGTTKLEVKCGVNLTAVYSTLCCGTVEIWDAVFNPDILGEQQGNELKPVCRGALPTNIDELTSLLE